MQHSESITAIAEALATFTAAVKNPPKGKTAEVRSRKGEGSSYTYQYADLAAVLDAVRPPMAEARLSLLQEIREDNSGRVGAATRLLHASGEWIEYEPIWKVPARTAANANGIAATFRRRYGIQSALGIAADGEDTDGDAGRHGRARSSGSSRPATERQIAKIRLDAQAAGISEGALISQLQKDFGANALPELTTQQASDLIDRIATERDRRSAAKAAGANPETGELPPPAESKQEPDGIDSLGMDAAANSAKCDGTPSAGDVLAQDPGREEGPPPEDPGPAEEPNDDTDLWPVGAAAPGAPARRTVPDDGGARATNPQKVALGRMVADLVNYGEYHEERDLEERYGVTGRSDLSKAQASDYIDHLVVLLSLARGHS
jgi:hypothetical protein